MTKSKGIGRGGKRSNPGGRPRKSANAPIPQPAPAAELPMVDDAELIEQAKRTLAAVMNDGKASSAAKVSAAKAAMALAGPGNAAAGGKKGAQAQAAKEAFARFATRPPPRLAVDNT